jgi:methyl-accepting chemotaxis protein
VSAPPGRAPRIPFDLRLSLITLLAGLPAVAVSLALLFRGGLSPKAQWTLAAIVVVAWIGLAVELRGRVANPLQALSNLLEALRTGDFSVRGRGARRGDPLGEVLLEVNALGDALREQRLGAL